MCDVAEGKRIFLGKDKRPFKECEEFQVLKNTCFRNTVLLIHVGLPDCWEESLLEICQILLGE